MTHVREALLLDRLHDGGKVVFDLEEDACVHCYHCMSQRCYDTYGRGDAFLAGPAHSPYDGNANYICRDHLDSGATLNGRPIHQATAGFATQLATAVQASVDGHDPLCMSILRGKDCDCGFTASPLASEPGVEGGTRE